MANRPAKQAKSTPQMPTSWLTFQITEEQYRNLLTVLDLADKAETKRARPSPFGGIAVNARWRDLLVQLQGQYEKQKKAP
jgi:hypothetical protein